MFLKNAVMIGFSLVLLAGANAVFAAGVNLNSPQWLGNLKLSADQLKTIKGAVEKALKAPIDAEQQCGAERGDCVVRAARQWKVGSDTYREIVIAIHAVGHTSHAIGQAKGKWPSIQTK